MKCYLTAKDCSPFRIDNKSKKGSSVSDRTIKIINDAFERLIKESNITRLKPYLPENKDDSEVIHRSGPGDDFVTDPDIIPGWTAGRYIGECVIGDVSISIKPRFGDGALLFMLEDFAHIKAIEADEQTGLSSRDQLLLYKIIWAIWIRKFGEADKYGLPRKNVERTYVGGRIRGRLDVRNSIPSILTEYQAVSHYREKDYDMSICRIILKSYEILTKRIPIGTIVPAQITNTMNGITEALHGENASIHEREYHAIKYGGIYQNWKPLVDFSWQIIKGYSFSLNNKSQGKGLNFFLDMAEIWESFLRSNLSRKLSDHGWVCYSQNECKSHVYPHQFYHRNIIPDIVFERSNNGRKQFIVLDAKYKRMDGKQWDVDREDFFQIHTYMQYYALKGDVILGGLLYPLPKNCQTGNGQWCSNGIFGESARTKFIVDGIRLNEDMNTKEEMEKEIAGLCDRICQISDVN